MYREIRCPCGCTRGDKDFVDCDCEVATEIRGSVGEMIAQEQPKQQILDNLVAEWGQEVIAAPYPVRADPVPEDGTTVTIVDTETNASTPDAGTGFSIVDDGIAPYVPPAGAAPSAPTPGGGGISPILWGLPLVMAVGGLVAFYSLRRRKVLAVNTRSAHRRNHRRKSKRSSRR